ncbi:hypothetical protein PDE_07545 [Penicillium oxalicum 114-2]|uniref:Uncharacterized protein n=1 Tax=Penicillium oxalicum (strain 114-2 / CGMCC 5302) TaxID=933388 RepID=S7ZPD9_PENO1|nr:hypothetical protein PDE_07545 [Penicillium oxalicum 114-2]
MFKNRSIVQITLWLGFLSLGWAQEYQQTIWGIFAFTTYGDKTPSLLADARPRVLSDYGANQLADAGTAFRDRYLSSGKDVNNSPSTIQYLSATVLDPQDVEIFASTDQFAIASAQAFMQGLYPPVGQAGLETSDVTANGSLRISPLNGYQYPQILTLGQTDPQSTILTGNENCPIYQAAESEYQNGDYAHGISQITNAFYVRLWNEVLSGVMDETSANYLNAVEIFEYIEYEMIHNSTVQTQLTEAEIRQARWWADHYTYATNHQSDFNKSTAESIMSIAGQTLAASIMNAFRLNIEESGTSQKLSLLFGGSDTAVALASLLRLPSDQQPNLYCRPNQGASLVFELFSFQAGESYPAYPAVDDLYVRFLIHNGTSNTTFSPYPMFGHGPSHEYIPYTEFQSELESFATQSTQNWCRQCNSEAIFCRVLDDERAYASMGDRKQMAPAVAGIIGAVIMLAIIGVLGAVGLCIWAMRKRETSRTPSLGGFKGTSKLASDLDVTFQGPHWTTSKNANDRSKINTADGIVIRGHERTGSWEMGQPKDTHEDLEIARHSSLSAPDDENEEEWRIVRGLRAVEARESV